MEKEDNQDNQYIIELIEGNRLSKKKKLNINFVDIPSSEIKLDFTNQFENESNFTCFKNFKEYTFCVFTQNINYENYVNLHYVNLYIFDNTFNTNKIIKIPFPQLNNKSISKKKFENKNFVSIIYESIDEKNGFLFFVIVNEVYILNIYKNDEGYIKYKKIFQDNKKNDFNKKNNIFYLGHNIYYDKKLLEFVTIIKPINSFIIYNLNYNDCKVEIQNYNLENQYRNQLQLNRFYTSKSEYYLFCENNNNSYILYKNINKKEFKVKKIVCEKYPEINLLKKPFSIIQNKITKNLILYTEITNKTNNNFCSIGVYELFFDSNIFQVQKLQEINLISENFEIKYQYFPNHNYIYFSDKHFLFLIVDENSSLINQIYKIKINEDKLYSIFEINNYNNNIALLFYNKNQTFDILLYEMKIENKIENNNDSDNENINENKKEIEKLFYNNDYDENAEKKEKKFEKKNEKLDLKSEINKIMNQKIEIYEKKLNYLCYNYCKIKQNQFNNIELISNLEKKLLEIKQIQINKKEQIQLNNFNFQNSLNQLFNQNQKLNQEILLNKSSSSQSSNDQN